jgi:Carboxypeptidase regulatory-like domain
MNFLNIRPLPGVAAAVCLLAGLTAGPLDAQGTIAGQVTDKSSQQPVVGVQVLVSGTTLQARTGREGHYSITNVPPGQYAVQARLIGYATRRRSRPESRSIHAISPMPADPPRTATSISGIG